MRLSRGNAAPEHCVRRDRKESDCPVWRATPCVGVIERHFQQDRFHLQPISDDFKRGAREVASAMPAEGAGNALQKNEQRA
jgi:hypothetical protein